MIEEKKVTCVVFVDLSEAYDNESVKKFILKVNDLTRDFEFEIAERDPIQPPISGTF